MYRVSTPEPGFTGESCGLEFVGGVAEVSDGPALRYFRGAGYGIEEIEQTPPAAPDAGNGRAVKPAGNGSADAWRVYAVASGMDPEQVAQMSRDDIKTAIASTEDGDQS